MKASCNIVLKRCFRTAGAITDKNCSIFKDLDAMTRQGILIMPLRGTTAAAESPAGKSEL